MQLKLIKESIAKGNVEWKKHVVQRIIERGIARSAVLEVLLEGEVIHNYPDDSPCPSALFFGLIAERPIHVVAAYDENSQITHIITAYEPSLGFFMDDFKTKRKQ